MKKEGLILAIDTSCDETSAAVLQGLKVLSNVISSQVELHRKWGGVVPDIARRAHSQNIELVIKESLKRASKQLKNNIGLQDIQTFAVTFGPGLAIALEIGISKAKELAEKYKKPLVAVNHMEGHLLSALAQNSKGNSNLQLSQLQFPVLGLLISGKHTEIVLMRAIGEYEVWGETLDDAVGEAYDKVARMLGLGYPGGATLSEFARKGRADAYKFPVPLAQDTTMNFSFSGLKTAVYYLTKKLGEGERPLTKQQILDISASFELAAIKHLTNKLQIAIHKSGAKMLLVGGGVASSKKVRATLRRICQKNGLQAFFPQGNRLYMDNAAMIGIAAHFKALRAEFVKELTTLDRKPRASIAD